MSPFVSLLKITFRNYYGLSVIREKYFRQKKNNLWRPLAALIGIGVGGASLLSFYLLLSQGLYTVGKIIGRPELGLELSLLCAWLVVFIFGISAIFGTLYFTEDSTLLASLPLKPFQVLAAKFSLVVFNQYLVLAYFLLPPMFIFAAGEGVSLFYVLNSVLVFLLYPVVPLALAAAVAVILMSRAGSKKLKDLFTYLVYIVLIGFGLGVQFLSRALPSRGGDLDILRNLVQSQGEALGLAEKGLPTAVWAAKALALSGTGGGWLNLVLFLGLTAVLLVLMLALGERFFYSGLLGGEEVPRQRRKLAVSSREWQKTSLFKALLLREHRLFIRTPVYMLNVLPVAVIVPLFMLFPLFSQDGGVEIAQLAPALARQPYLKLLITAVMIFIAGTLPLASSALSREGRLFSLSLLIPVSPGQQLSAKFWYSLMVNFLCTLPFFSIAAVLAKLSWFEVLALGLFGMAGTAVVTGQGLLLDLRAPFFNWENPQRAVKNNFNVVWGMLLTVLFLGILAGVAAALAFTVPWAVGYLLLLLIASGIAWALYRYLVSKAGKRYQELEG